MANAILVLILAATSFINFYQANNSINRGTFFMMRDHVAKADPSRDDAKDTKNVIDESFHKCSKEKSCCKVAENVKSNKNGIVAVGEELPLEKQDARIWHKGMSFKMTFEVILFVDRKSWPSHYDCLDLVPKVLDIGGSSLSLANHWLGCYCHMALHLLLFFLY